MSPSSELVVIAKRSEIEPLTHVETDVGIVDIGEHRDFKKHEALRQLGESGASFAWTMLTPGRTLPVHEHPVDTMVIVCEGRGAYFGEFDAPLAAGDVVYVKAGAKHGFRASDDVPMHCLSVQLSERGLYDRGREPLASFASDEAYAEILELNASKQRRFAKLCLALHQDGVRLGQSQRDVMFGLVGRWSTIFQKILFLRQAHTTDPHIYSLFQKHLADEFGHDLHLRDFHYRRDVSLEASFSWFVNQMYVLADEEKLILVHLVLESASDAFHEAFSAERTSDGSFDYVRAHHIDKEHAAIGSEIIRAYSFRRRDRVKALCNDGWDILTAAFERVRLLAAQ